MADYQGIFSSGGGGVQTIGAGTNIVVNNADPSNPVVSVTGVAAASHTHAASDVTSGVFAVARLGTGTPTVSLYLRGDGQWIGLDASHLVSGTVPTARLGTGTANSTTFLRGDQTWQTITGGVNGFEPTIITSPSPWTATDANARLLANGPSSNISISLQPKNAGSLTADRADNTTAGGNLRGQYAVDWQFGNRSQGANRVASGNYSVVCGGTNNQASGLESIVVGGNNNRATHSRSIIVGGVNNLAQNFDAVIVGGNANSASGQLSFIGGGQSNQTSGQYSVVGGGQSNHAAQQHSTIGGGQFNLANGTNSCIVGGEQNMTSHSHTTILGGRYGATRNVGSVVYSNHYNWTVGDAQFADNIYTARFTGAGTNTVTIMGGLSQGVYVPNSSAVTFNILVSARELFTNNVGGWIISGVAQTNGSTLSLTHVTVNLLHRSVGTWDVTVIADTVNQTINLRATQSAGNAIQWVGTGRFCYCTMNG
jgi:hypothetical protein